MQILYARRWEGSRWRLDLALVRFDGSAADPTIREISMVSGAVKAAKKGGWRHRGEAASPNVMEHHLKDVKGPSLSQNVAGNSGYKDRHGVG